MPGRPDPEVEAIIEARHGDPFSFLGMHPTSGGVCLRAMLPAAQEMAVVDSATGKIAAKGVRVHSDGFFVATVADRKEPFRYRLRISRGAIEQEFDDVYRFPPVLGELDTYLLAEGNHLASYRKLGAHPLIHEGVEGVAFAVWAPNARRVSVVGDFNAWDGRRMPMRNVRGFWELFVPGLRPGQLYKYEIVGAHGQLLPLKADPQAERTERPPNTASVIADPSRHVWQDGTWMAERWRQNDREAPISIYEVHLGSWRRNLAQNGRYLTYRELTDQLVPYAAEMGFTHIEVMPVTGISVRRILGVPADLSVRADQPVRDTGRFPRFCRCLSSRRPWFVARLGSRSLPDRPARARASTGRRFMNMPTRGRGFTPTGIH